MVARRGRVDGTAGAARELAAFAKAPRGTPSTRSTRSPRRASICAAEEFIDGTELDFLFDQQRHLFAIGYNVTEGRRDSTFYDALASEARLASFVAIATAPRVRRNIGSSSAV